MALGKTLIIQNLQGIGDTCWFIKHYHAIANKTASKKVSILTRPRSMADQILKDDPYVEQVLWLHVKRGIHDGMMGTWRLARDLKVHQFDTVWILHSRSLRYALACRLAGIKDIRGPGIGFQKHLLTTAPFLEEAEQTRHPIKRGTLLLEKHGFFLDPSSLLPIGTKEEHWAKNTLSTLPKPWVGIGLSSSESHKKWPLEHYKTLAEMIYQQKGGSILILGGPKEAEEGARLAATLKDIPCLSVTSQPISDSLALIKQLDFLIGNDTGILHAAPQVGSKGLVLLGKSQVPIHHHTLVEGIHLDPEETLQEGPNDIHKLQPEKVFEKLKALGWV
jgi:heptosyltransferase-2